MQVGFESSLGEREFFGVSELLAIRGLWSLLLNSWLVEGLHGEEGTGVCLRELETLWSLLGSENSICVALRPDSPLTIGVAFYDGPPDGVSPRRVIIEHSM